MRPRPITLQDLPNLPEVFLGLAGLLMIIVGASALATPVIGAFGGTYIVMGLIMGASALISLGFMESPLLKNMFSFLTISATFGFLLFIIWIALLTVPGGSSAWTTWVIFVAALLSLFAAYRAILLRRY
jgi:hypothetical protein